MITTASIATAKGGMIYIDELDFDTPTPVEVMTEHLADLHGVSPKQVFLESTANQGHVLVGKFVVRKPGQEYWQRG